MTTDKRDDIIKRICIWVGLCAIVVMVGHLDPFLPFVEFTSIAEEGGIMPVIRQTTLQDVLIYAGTAVVVLALVYDVGVRPEDE